MSTTTFTEALASDPAATEQQEIFPLLEELSCQVRDCQQCTLSKTRIQTVFSDGNALAKLMIIGEAPGQNEDETGIPFVGRAGQLLTKILASVGIDRQQDTYICNTVKCRPPQNRKPLPEEMTACFPFLQEQIRLIQPRVILLTGATAVKDILKTAQPISKIRGQWFNIPDCQAKIMPIFHPSYLLRNPSTKEGSPKWWMWQDIKMVRKELDDLNIATHGTPSKAFLIHQ